MSHRPIVFLWGAYTEGNYGDDLMCVMFALKLLKANIHPVVYGMHPMICRSYGLERCDNVDDALRQCDACVIGGGAFLQNSCSTFYDNLKTLLELCDKYSLPVFASSIGGDYDMNNPDSGLCGVIPKQFDLFKNCSNLINTTVRLKSDVYSLQGYIDNVEYFPDVVLACHGFVNKSDTHQKKSIFVSANASLKNALFYKILSLLVKIRGYRLVFLRTYLSSSTYYKNDLVLKGHDFICYSDPLDFAREISKASILLSNKLHVGVTALSFGVPFISFGGKNKTRLFFTEMKLNRFLFPKEKPLKLLAAFTNPKHNIILPFHQNRLDILLQKSAIKAESHFDLLIEKLKEISSK